MRLNAHARLRRIGAEEYSLAGRLPRSPSDADLSYLIRVLIIGADDMEARILSIVENLHRVERSFWEFGAHPL